MLTYSLETGATFGSVTIDPSTGSFEYSPVNNWSGEDDFEITVHDGRESSDSYPVRMKVHARADPAWVSVKGGQGDEDTFIRIRIRAQSVDDDGSERCIVVISGLRWERVPLVTGSDTTQPFFPSILRAVRQDGTDKFFHSDPVTQMLSLACETIDGQELAVQPPLHSDMD